MADKEKKVGCPFCTRESNRPNNVVVHIMGQHQGLCKEKISRIRSPVPAVAMREAMLLFMKDKFETDDTIRLLVEENEKLRWAVASLGPSPNPGGRLGAGFVMHNTVPQHLGPQHNAMFYERAKRIDTDSHESSEDYSDEGEEYGYGEVTGSKKRKIRGGTIKKEATSSMTKGTTRGRKKKRLSSEEENSNEEEEEEERGYSSSSVSSPRVKEDGYEPGGLCVVKWKDYVLSILTEYYKRLTTEDNGEEEPLLENDKNIYLLVNSAHTENTTLRNAKGKTRVKQANGTCYLMTLEELRKIFPTNPSVTAVHRVATFDKLLEEVLPEIHPSQYKIIGTIDTCYVPKGERLLDKLLRSNSGGWGSAARAEFVRLVEKESREWERGNPVEKFGNFLVSLPKSFADILLTMHPILENIALAKVEKTSLLQRVKRIIELLTQSKALISAKIGEYKQQLGAKFVILEGQLSQSEEFVKGAILKLEDEEEEVLRRCLHSFVAIKQVLSAFHEQLQLVTEKSSYEHASVPSLPPSPPSSSYLHPTSPPPMYITNTHDVSSLLPPSAAYTAATSRKSYSFTQAMSRLLNAIHLCNDTKPTKSSSSSSGRQIQPQQQPSPPQQQYKQQHPPQQPPPPPAYYHSQPQLSMAHSSPAMDLSAAAAMYSMSPSAAVTIQPSFPIISRPVPLSAFSSLQHQQQLSPPSSASKISFHDAGSAFTSPRPAKKSSSSAFVEINPKKTSNTTTTTTTTHNSNSAHQGCKAVYRKTFVFIVAVEAFRDPAIPSRLGAADDALLVERSLNQLPGYQVRALINEQATKENIRKALLSDMATAEANDRVLIFVDSQGVTSRLSSTGETVGVLCCHETSSSNPADTGLLPSELLTWIPRARHVALFMDCPFAATGLYPFGETPIRASWESLAQRLAAQYLWSGESGGKGGRSGVFLKCLVEAFSGAVFDYYKKDWVRMSELCAWICDGVFRSTRGRQEPQGGRVLSDLVEGDGGGEVLFLRPGLGCLPVDSPSRPTHHAPTYISLDVKELRYLGFMGTGVSQMVMEKHKVLIEDTANGIFVGQKESLDRNSALIASSEEYVAVLRSKVPSTTLTSEQLLAELLKKGQGGAYTITLPC